MKKAWSKLSLLLFLATAFLLSGCKAKPEPPKFKIIITPDDGITRPGGTIELACEREIVLGKPKETYKFTTTYESKCKLKEIENKGYYAKYKVDPDCLEGKIKFTVKAEGKGGVTTKTAEFTVKRKMLVWEVLPERPNPIPKNWVMIDDFEKPGKFNLWKGFRGDWTYRNGKCKFSIKNGVLEIDYKLPFKGLSACGFFEYFEGDEGKAVKKDISPYKRVTFMIKSGDGKIHKVRFELVEYDEFAQFNQGAVATTDKVILATKYWRRVEIPFPHFARGFKFKSAKSFSIKIDSADDNFLEGKVLIDNIAFIK